MQRLFDIEVLVLLCAKLVLRANIQEKLTKLMHQTNNAEEAPRKARQCSNALTKQSS